MKKSTARQKLRHVKRIRLTSELHRLIRQVERYPDLRDCGMELRKANTQLWQRIMDRYLAGK